MFVLVLVSSGPESLSAGEAVGDGQSLLWDLAAPGRPGPGFLPVRRRRVPHGLCGGAEAQAWPWVWAAESFSDPRPPLVFSPSPSPQHRLS
ncbi:unnamed protein product [Rangifer tarandus platyrhynchus]|uniref:Uncharacterized protein n=1 Tax=Rangifer tarandus platyrhynchus TaxID=3082113 RepID=A0AC59YT66_RANTA